MASDEDNARLLIAHLRERRIADDPGPNLSDIPSILSIDPKQAKAAVLHAEARQWVFVRRNVGIDRKQTATIELLPTGLLEAGRNAAQPRDAHSALTAGGDIVIGNKVNAGRDAMVAGDRSAINVDNSTTYEIPHEPNKVYDAVLEFIVDKLGESATWGVGAGAFTLGSASLVVQVGQRPAIVIQVIPSWLLVWFGWIAILLGALVLAAANHYRRTLCPRCRTKYALVQVSDTQVREVKTSEGIRKTKTWKERCSQCGYARDRKKHDLDATPSLR